MLATKTRLLDSGWRNVLRHVPPSSVLYLAGLPEGFESAKVKDFSGNNNHGAVSGALWERLRSGLTYLNLDGSDDVITVTNHASLDITSEDFTIYTLCNFKAISEQNDLYGRGLVNTDGFIFYVTAANHVRLDTWQAAAEQTSRSLGSVTAANRWYVLGAARSGASIRIYQDGVDVTNAAGTHINPTTNTRDALIGQYATNFSNTKFALTVLIKGVAYTAAQMKQVYQDLIRLAR